MGFSRTPCATSAFKIYFNRQRYPGVCSSGVVVAVVFILKAVLISVQYLLTHVLVQLTRTTSSVAIG